MSAYFSMKLASAGDGELYAGLCLERPTTLEDTEDRCVNLANSLRLLSLPVRSLVRSFVCDRCLFLSLSLERRARAFSHAHSYSYPCNCVLQSYATAASSRPPDFHRQKSTCQCFFIIIRLGRNQTLEITAWRLPCMRTRSVLGFMEAGD